MAEVLVKKETNQKTHNTGIVLRVTSKLTTFSFSSEHPLLRWEEQEAGSHTDPSAGPGRAQMESQPHTLTGPSLPAMLKLLRGSEATGTIRSPCLTSCTSQAIVFHPLIHVLSQITQIWLKCLFYKGIQTEYKALQDEEKLLFFFFSLK